jgi:hypothetical protein
MDCEKRDLALAVEQSVYVSYKCDDREVQYLISTHTLENCAHDADNDNSIIYNVLENDDMSARVQHNHSDTLNSQTANASMVIVPSSCVNKYL